MPTDIRQSVLFAHFMQNIGWTVKKVNRQFVYLRVFPFIGSFAKMPRPTQPVPFQMLPSFLKKNRVFHFKIAPHVTLSEKQAKTLQTQFRQNGFHVEMAPFNPTTTITIDLKKSEEELFSRFTSAKRRAVRRAKKHGVSVQESQEIEEFISIRKKQYFPFGFLMTNETRKIWSNFAPKNACLLIAYKEKEPLAGILLLLYGRVAYYWFASATKQGKKLFAPSILVWEALKYAKKRGCTQFDFEGIYDDRFPKAAESWRGFTKFKEGFGGNKVIYIENFKLRSLLPTILY